MHAVAQTPRNKQTNDQSWLGGKASVKEYHISLSISLFYLPCFYPQETVLQAELNRAMMRCAIRSRAPEPFMAINDSLPVFLSSVAVSFPRLLVEAAHA